MAKAKHQKAKPSRKAKQPHPKKRGGKQNDVTELRAQLDTFGLKIIQVTADGNCFFRALADQLEGDEDEHGKYRSMVVQFIKNNREMFEPFIEDEVPFEEYCRSMGEDGTWAGHMELQAASLVTCSNICIHRNMSPRWYIQNFNKHEAQMIHLLQNMTRNLVKRTPESAYLKQYKAIHPGMPMHSQEKTPRPGTISLDHFPLNLESNLDLCLICVYLWLLEKELGSALSNILCLTLSLFKNYLLLFPILSHVLIMWTFQSLYKKLYRSLNGRQQFCRK